MMEYHKQKKSFKKISPFIYLLCVLTSHLTCATEDGDAEDVEEKHPILLISEPELEYKYKTTSDKRVLESWDAPLVPSKVQPNITISDSSFNLLIQQGGWQPHADMQ